MSSVTPTSPRLRVACVSDDIRYIVAAHNIYSVDDVDVDVDTVGEYVSDMLYDEAGLDYDMVRRSVFNIANARELEFRRGLQVIEKASDQHQPEPSKLPVTASVTTLCSRPSSASSILPVLAVDHGRRFKRGVPSPSDTTQLQRRRFALASTIRVPDQGAHTEPREVAKATWYANALWQCFLEIGDQSTIWESEFQNAFALDERRELQVSIWLELPVTSLGQHHRAFVRWIDYC